MIQDICPHIFYNQYRPCPPKPDSYVLVFEEKKVLCSKKDGKIDFPRFRDLAEDFPDITERWIYLFTVDEQAFYLLADAKPPAERKNISRIPYVPRHAPETEPASEKERQVSSNVSEVLHSPEAEQASGKETPVSSSVSEVLHSREAERAFGKETSVSSSVGEVLHSPEAEQASGMESSGKAVPAGAGFAMESTQVFRRGEPKYLAFAGITGYQLWGWYRSRRFCGRCGSRMVHDEKERMMRCPVCGNMEFPKICPAVIIGVTDGSRILMSRYAGRSYKSYALLAGFTEIGETVEETVHREVMEEVGLRVKNLRYYKSQPWPFSDTLLMGFYCDLDGDARITLDQNELSAAEWVEREDITVTPTDDSLTNEMIVNFKNGEV